MKKIISISIASFICISFIAGAIALTSLHNNKDKPAYAGVNIDAYYADAWGSSPVKAQGDKNTIHYTGDGFVKDINDAENCGVTFHNISVEESGCYPLFAHYCTGSTEGGATFRVYVDDGVTDKFYGALNCNIITGWDVFGDNTIAQTYINLEKGKTYDVVLKGGYSYAELDYIRIGNRVGPSMTRYEAESYRESGVTATESIYASQGHGAGDIETNKGVDFVINITEESSYDLLISQCTDPGMTGNSASKVYIDGVSTGNVYCTYKTGWGVFDDNPVNKITTNLTAGEHHIRVVKADGNDNYIQLDYLDVKKNLSDSDYTLYEAEEGITNASIYADTSAVFSGSGYVGDLNRTGLDYVAFQVSAATTGNYEVLVCYAIGGGVPVPATFTVANNDGNFTTVSCNSVNGWGHFNDLVYETCYVKLYEGDNIITFFKDDSYAQIDYIKVSKTASGTSDGNCQYRRMEAEEANIMNACIKPSGSASGGSYVGDLSETCYVEFPVYVARDGLYELAYCYCRPDSPSTTSVTGGSYGRGDRPYINFTRENTVISSGWGQFTTATTVKYDKNDENFNMVTVNLRAGYSYIAIRPESDSKTFELDYIEIGRRIGDYDVSKLGIDSLLYRGN